jgi:hypothetical protein
MQDYEAARLLISYGLRETAKWAAPPAAVAAAVAAGTSPEFTTPGRPARPAGSSSSSSAHGTPGGLSALNAVAAAGATAAAAIPLCEVAADQVGEVAWWRLQRLKLLQLHDRLEAAVVSRRYSV